MNTPDPEPEMTPEEWHRKVAEAIDWVADIMNSGKPRAEDVYPRDRYSGD